MATIAFWDTELAFQGLLRLSCGAEDLEGQADGEEPVAAQGVVQAGKGVAVATDRGPCAVAGDGGAPCQTGC